MVRHKNHDRVQYKKIKLILMITSTHILFLFECRLSVNLTFENGHIMHNVLRLNNEFIFKLKENFKMKLMTSITLRGDKKPHKPPATH